MGVLDGHVETSMHVSGEKPELDAVVFERANLSMYFYS